MSKSQHNNPLDILNECDEFSPESLFSGGMNIKCRIIPENVIVRVADQNHASVPAAHGRIILKVQLSGKSILCLDGIQLILHPGDAVLIFPYQIHHTRLEDSLEHKFVAISFAVPQNNCSAFDQLKNRVWNLNKAELSLVVKIVTAFHSAPKNNTEAILALIKLMEALLEREESHSPSEYADNSFYQICNYFRKKFTTQISLKTVANHFGLSPESIRKMFHRHFGTVTPGKLLANFRLRHAMTLLENTELPVTDVAIRSGFSNMSVFSKSFKRFCGKSPLEYRRGKNNA